MFCVFCGKNIEDDSVFCPYCGKSVSKQSVSYCRFCGKQIPQDSTFCPYCGKHKSDDKEESLLKKIKPKNIRGIITNRFFVLFVIWIFIQIMLYSNAGDAYSDYFNSSHLSTNYNWSENKGIYPNNWLYPFCNIFRGIMGQDPIYVYDEFELIVYLFLVPIALLFLYKKARKWFKTSRALIIWREIIWFFSLWLIVLFPMGFFGLDYLGCTFSIGAIIIAVYAYYAIKKKLDKASL